jgi:hypothetical protein
MKRRTRRLGEQSHEEERDVLVHEEREAKGDLSSMMALTKDKARRWRRTWACSAHRRATGRTGRRWVRSISLTGRWCSAHTQRGVGQVGRGPDQISSGPVL